VESQILSPLNFRNSGHHLGLQKTPCLEKIIFRLFCSLFVILLFNSCKKSSPTDYSTNLTITGVNPLTGKHGDTIIITGTNFNLNPTLDVVKFNGIPAQVQKAKTDSLFVIVPTGNCTGVVTVNGIKAPGPIFTDTSTQVNFTITGVKPAWGKQGDAIIITGTHFNLNPADDTVKINGVTAVVQKASADTLYVIVPLTGTGFVTVNGEQAPGPAFIYAPTIIVTTFAGSGPLSFPGGFADGPDSLALFNGPSEICFDNQGNLFVLDPGNSCVRKIAAGIVSTFAGGHLSGYQIGPAIFADLSYLTGITLDAQNSIYVSESIPNRIKKIGSGMVSNYAGSGDWNTVDGQDTLASFFRPEQITIDAQDNIYVAEIGALRKISPTGMVSTFAGKGTKYGVIDPVSGRMGFISNLGYTDGPDTSARFGEIVSLATDANDNVYVGDLGCYCIRKVTPAGLVSTFALGTGHATVINPSDPGPQGICVDPAGNVYVSQKSSILKITPDGTVSTLVGTATPGYTDGPIGVAQFNNPEGLAFDAQGNLYVADTGNLRIRKITFQ
jgi:hypothetical protein